MGAMEHNRIALSLLWFFPRQEQLFQVNQSEASQLLSAVSKTK